MTRELEGFVSSIEHAKEIAGRVLNEGYDPLLACRELAQLRQRLPGVPDEIMDVFVGIASEVDGLPIGGERRYWAVGELRLRDAEAARYRERVRAVVEESLVRLLASLSRSQ